MAKILSANPKPIVLPCYPTGNRRAEKRNNWSRGHMRAGNSLILKPDLPRMPHSAMHYTLISRRLSGEVQRGLGTQLPWPRLNSPEEENASRISRERIRSLRYFHGNWKSYWRKLKAKFLFAAPLCAPTGSEQSFKKAIHFHLARSDSPHSLLLPQCRKGTQPEWHH